MEFWGSSGSVGHQMADTTESGGESPFHQVLTMKWVPCCFFRYFGIDDKVFASLLQELDTVSTKGTGTSASNLVMFICHELVLHLDS